MAGFKSTYLIHGDDHGRIAERRGRLRIVAEGESGEGGVEILEGEAASVEGAVAASCAMSLTPGRRFVIVDGVQRWKAADLGPLLELIADMPPETTLAMFAREEGRDRVPDGLADAVAKAGGVVQEEAQVKPWKLPDWVRGQARKLGLELDATAAKTLVQTVGERQQRLMRELEKIAIHSGPGARVDAEDIAAIASGSAERKAWTLADSLVGGQGRRATMVWLELEQQGERAGALVGIGGRRLREAVAASERLEAGESAAQVRGSLRMPPKAADAFLRDVAQGDPDSFRDRLAALADLELATRGGGRPMSEATAVARTLSEIFR